MRTLIGIGLLLVSSALLAAPAQIEIGNIPAEFKVLPNAAASYTIPIELPSGLGGAQPGLKLSYNSLAGNGLLGQGWILEGFHEISRCPATLVSDGAFSTLNNGDDYRFCLNGQRLVRISGNEYRLENETYSRIMADGGTQAVPDAFRVFQRDGTILHLGLSSNAKWSNSTESYRYLLSKVEDISGNYYEIAWQAPNANERYPDFIEYSKNPQATGTGHRIEFIYETREDTSARYMAGNEEKTLKRLTRIDILSNGSRIANYQFHYQAIDGTNTADPVKTSRLEKIYRCSASLDQCANPTLFTWTPSDIASYGFSARPFPHLTETNPQSYWYEQADISTQGVSEWGWWLRYQVQSLIDPLTNPRYVIGDFTGNFATDLVDLWGIPLIPDYWPGYRQVYAPGINGTLVPYATSVMDLDADGHDDILTFDQLYSQGIKAWAYDAQSNIYFSEMPGYQVAANDLGFVRTCAGVTQWFTYRLYFADFNGDGLIDILRFAPTCLGGLNNFPTDVSVALNNGSGFDSFVQWATHGQFGAGWTPYSINKIADVNGDSLPDIVGANGEVAINTGSSFTNDPNWGSLGTAVYGYFSWLVDMNADGMADLVLWRNDHLEVRLSSGKGFLPIEYWMEGLGNPDTLYPTRWPMQLSFSDVNADGKMDLVLHYTSNQWSGSTPVCLNMAGVHAVAYGKGHVSSPTAKDAFTLFYPILPNFDSSGTWCYGLHTQLGPMPMTGFSLLRDMNNDGMPDLAGYNQIKKPLVIGIEDGLGNTTTINYLPLSYGANYRKGVPIGQQPGVLAADFLSDQASKGREGYSASNASAVSLSPEVAQAMPTTPGSLTGRYGVYRAIETDAEGKGINTRYFYSNNLYSKAGWGELGFERIETIAMDTAEDTFHCKDTIHWQQTGSQYRIAGVPRQQITRASDYSCMPVQSGDPIPEPVSISWQNWYVRLFNDTANGEPHYFPYLESNQTDHYDLDESFRFSEATKRTPTVDVECNITPQAVGITSQPDHFDNDGNLPWEMKASCSDELVTAKAWVRSDFDSRKTPSRWVLGLVRDEWEYDAVFYDSNDYDFYGRDRWLDYDSLGRPIEERILPLHPREVKYEYSYNDYGTVSQTVESWTDPGDDGLDFNNRTSSVLETYNLGERSLQTTNALGHVETTVHDLWGRPRQHTEANGRITTWSYDWQGRITLENPPTVMDTVTSYHGGAGSHCPAGTAWYSHANTGNGSTSIQTYQCQDSRSRLLREVSFNLDGSPIYRDQRYDIWGNTVRIYEPRFSTDSNLFYTETEYDSLNRPILVTRPDGGSTTYAYTALDRLQTDTVIGRSTTTHNRWQRLHGDGRLLASRDHEGTEVRFRYHPFGDLARTVLWVNGQERADTAITMEYDVLGRRTRILDPDAGERTFAYNALDQVHRETDAKGQVTRSAYDKLGRLRVRIDDATAPNPGERTHQWTWDIATHGIGQLASLTGFDTDGNAYSEHYYYEATLGQLRRTDILSQGRTYYLQTGYDGFGRPAVIMRQSSEVWPSDHYWFYLRKVYDNRGYLIREHKNGDPNTVYWQLDSLNARGQVTAETYGNGVVTTRSFDPASGRPLSLQAIHGSTVIAQQSWAWDTAGNLLEREDGVANLSQTLCYDSLHRLTAALVGDCTTLIQPQFAYDALGNLTHRLSSLWGIPVELEYQYGPSPTSPHAGPHALTHAEVPGHAQITIDYDLNGNLVSDDWIPRTISWNAYNLPATVINQNIVDGQLALSYTPDRERLTRNDYDERHTTYARPGYYEREQEGSRIRYRYYLGDYAFLDRINDGGVLSEVIHYRHADPQNSLIATSSANPGADTQAYAYEAWGIPLYDDWNGWIRDWDDPLPTSQRGYTGQEHLQQSGLLHLNGRVYDPYTARFLSPDPELQDPADTQSYNRYSYVLNNPFKYVDPTGFDADPIRLPTIRVEVPPLSPLSMDDYLAKGGSGITRDYFQDISHYNVQPAHPYLTMNMADIRQLETAAVIDVVAGRFETVLTFAPTPVAVELWAAKIVAGTLPLALRLKAVASGKDNFVDGYRAVSKAEADDIAKHGFRPDQSGRSMQDKWFSETRGGAEKFRKNYSDLDHVVKAKVPKDIYDRSYKHPNIDNTGPGFCISCNDLSRVKVGQ